ncbi:hypothetical protein V7147_08115 [Bacillus sp. JJ1521]|uniref:hypothetical protein n=1 Tax=Bacillus sp. JJ1521 TaxID=3122957 RepID=UPI0030006530
MKKGLLIGLAYGLFILLAVGIGLFYSTFDVPSNKIISDAKQTEVTQSFEEALKADNERVEKKKEVQKTIIDGSRLLLLFWSRFPLGPLPIL